MKTDILVIGSGLIGSAVSRLVRQHSPAATIVMVDSGPAVGDVPGLHLHDTTDDSIWLYHQRQITRLQALSNSSYMGPDTSQSPIGLTSGMSSLAAFGMDTSAMPGLALSWNTGGMGIYWTGATPTPWGSEIPTCIAADEWLSDLATAQSLMRVNQNPFDSSKTGAALRSALNNLYRGVSAPSRDVRPMPMACTTIEPGGLRLVGPNVIFPGMSNGSDDRFRLYPSTHAIRLNHDGRTVAGAELLDISSGSVWSVDSSVTVVCAGAIRTPQLLYASGISPPALGGFLNEHAVVSGRIQADPRLLGVSLNELPAIGDRDWGFGLHWLPHSGKDQPFHGQIREVMVDRGTDGRLDYLIGLSFYVPTEIHEENRLEFSDAETDPLGMPKATVRFTRSRRDIDLIGQGTVAHGIAADRLGQFDLLGESVLRPPGSSLHITGTVRMGSEDDGSSVCDNDMRLWEYRNLFVAGCGAIPTAMACNATLTGTVTAVRAARAAAKLLNSLPLREAAGSPK